MKKIGIFFDTGKTSGGAHNQNLNLIDIFSKYLSKDFDFTYIVTNSQLHRNIDEIGQKSLLLKKNFMFRLELFLHKFSFFREIYKKLSLFTIFEKICEQNNFDLIYFNAPYEVILLNNKFNFITMLLSVQHRSIPIFPEYKKNHDNEVRDEIIIYSLNKSFKVFVGAEKDKEYLINLFSGDKNKIEVMPYTFTLPKIHQKNKELDFKKIYEKLKLPNFKDVIIYPAQFWAHKNHRYIIDIGNLLKERNEKNLYFVFCGSDKGNLNNISHLIKTYGLEEYFKIFNYIEDNELISMYLNCFGVIMPTYIGHSTIPMYEAFYFKKNFFFTKDLADNKLKNFVTEIDTSSPNSFYQKYLEIKKDRINNEKKLNKAKFFFDNECNDEVLFKKIKKTFDDYFLLERSWKK